MSEAGKPGVLPLAPKIVLVGGQYMTIRTVSRRRAKTGQAATARPA